MIRLKNILLEKDEKSDSENPDKILVKNKKSQVDYYISKDSFDPSIHEKPIEKKKKKEEPTTPPKEKVSSGEEEVAPVDKKEKDAKEKEKKLTPSETLEKKLGSYVYLDNKEQAEITDDAKNFRPDLKKKLLKFEFTPFFRSYDELLDTLNASNLFPDVPPPTVKKLVVSVPTFHDPTTV